MSRRGPYGGIGSALPAVIAQPPSDTQASSYTIAAVDIGGVIHASGAGAQAFLLNTLASSLRSGGEESFTIQQEGAATAVTVTCGAGVTINGSGSAYALPVGRSRATFLSRDGLAWFAA